MCVLDFNRFICHKECGSVRKFSEFISPLFFITFPVAFIFHGLKNGTQNDGVAVVILNETTSS